jgi:hypothetical protein
MSVAFSNARREGLMALDAFLPLHRDGALYRMGDFIRVVGVDDERVPQILCGAGEAREHKDPGIFFVLGDDIFLIDPSRTDNGGHDLSADAQGVARLGFPTQDSANKAAEVLSVGLGLKAHDVIGAKRAHEPDASWHGGQNLWRGEGNMQEESQPVGHAEHLQVRAKRDQVIILHPYRARLSSRAVRKCALRIRRQ